MSSSVLHAIGPTAVAFSLLGWLPWGNKQPALQEADYSSKAAAEGPVPEARLKDVQVLFRHGARTPVTSNEEYWKGTTWDVCGDKLESLTKSLRKGAEKKLPVPNLAVFDKVSLKPQETCIDQSWDHKVIKGGCTKGELTKLGQEQAVCLGTWLRHRYTGQAALLPDAYSKETVTAHSTNYRRTRGTMRGVLLGLYPGSTEEYQVETSLHDDELMLFQVSSCEKLKAWYTPNKKRLVASDVTDPDRVESEKHMRGVLGYDKDSENIEKRIHFGELNDALTSMRAHKKSINPNLTSVDLDLINRLATERVNNLLSGEGEPEPLTLGLGVLVGIMSDRMHAATADSSPKLSLWCGHDTTLMPMMSILGNRLMRWPPYASSVVLELWEDTSADAAKLPAAQRHYVRVLFNGQEVTIRTTPGCGKRDPPCSVYDYEGMEEQSEQLPQALTLQELEDEVLSAFALTPEHHTERCKLPTGMWDFLNLEGAGKKTAEDTSKY